MARRIHEGDEDAFRELFEAHARGLYRFVTARIGPNPEVTREIVHTTFVEALASLGSFRGTGSLAAWLFGICRFELHAHYRHKKKAQRHGPLEEAFAEPSPAEGPLARIERREQKQLIHETLDRLPRRYGDALEWKYIDALPVGEIGARLDMTPKAAESLLTRARQAFRTEFERARRAGGSQ